MSEQDFKFVKEKKALWKKTEGFPNLEKPELLSKDDIKRIEVQADIAECMDDVEAKSSMDGLLSEIYTIHDIKIKKVK